MTVKNETDAKPFACGIVDEHRKIVYVTQILDDTHFLGEWKGQSYEVRALPSTAGLSVGDEPIAHALPGNSELIVITWGGIVFLGGDDGGNDTPWVLYTEAIDAPSPTWVDITRNLSTTGADRFEKFILDRWNNDRGWVLTQNYAEYCPGLRAGSNWSRRFDQSTFEALIGRSVNKYKHIDMQGTLRPGGEGTFYILLEIEHQYNSNFYEAWVAWTTDFGSSWNAVAPIPAVPETVAPYWSLWEYPMDLEVSQYNNDVWMLGWHAVSPRVNIFRSIDGGATWDGGNLVYVWTAAGYAPVFLHQPYADSGADIFWATGPECKWNKNVQKSPDAGASWADWRDGTRESSVGLTLASRPKDFVQTFASNQNRLIACNELATTCGGQGKILRSEDGFVTYSTKQIPASAGARRATAISLTPGNWGHILVGTDVTAVLRIVLVWRSVDGGDNWQNKTGNAITLLDARYGISAHRPLTITTTGNAEL